MDVVIETCIKYSGGPTRMRVTDIYSYINSQYNTNIEL
jgi:hypothetical protein